MIPPLPSCEGMASLAFPLSRFQLLRVIVPRDLWRPPRERGIVHEYFVTKSRASFKFIYIYIYYTGINYVEQGIHEGNQTTPHNSLRNGETLLRMIMNDPSLFLLRSMSFALAEVKC